MTHFWNNLHQVLIVKRLESEIVMVKVFESKDTK